MAFSNVNQIVSSLATQKTSRFDWYYGTRVGAPSTVNFTSGLDLSTSNTSFSDANLFPGANLTWTSCNASSSFSLPHGISNGQVYANTQHLVNICSYSPTYVGTAPSVGGFLVLVDLQGYWPNVNYNTTTIQNLQGTPELRYPGGDGCRLYLVTTGAAGATAQNIRVFYDNQANVTSNSTFVSMRASSAVGQLGLPGIAPYIPLVNAGTGVSNCSNVAFSAANTGRGALCLAKPLAYVPFTTASSVTTEREFIYQTPTFPRIMDNACLTFLMVSGIGGSSSTISTNTPFSGYIGTVWG